MKNWLIAIGLVLLYVIGISAVTLLKYLYPEALPIIGMLCIIYLVVAFKRYIDKADKKNAEKVIIIVKSVGNDEAEKQSGKEEKNVEENKAVD